MNVRSANFAVVALLCLIAGAPSLAHAETRDLFVHGDKSDVDAAKTYAVDTAIPVAPAFSLLGGDTPQGIGAPFGGDSFFNIGAGNGNIPDVGAAARPYWTLFRRRQTLADYRGGEGTRALDNLHFDDRLRHIAGRTLLSGAVGTIPGETKRAGAALGLSTSLLHNTDPRLDGAFSDCVQKLLSDVTMPVWKENVRSEFMQMLQAKGLLRQPGDTNATNQRLSAAIAAALAAAKGSEIQGAVTAPYDAETRLYRARRDLLAANRPKAKAAVTLSANNQSPSHNTIIAALRAAGLLQLPTWDGATQPAEDAALRERITANLAAADPSMTRMQDAVDAAYAAEITASSAAIALVAQQKAGVMPEIAAYLEQNGPAIKDDEYDACVKAATTRYELEPDLTVGVGAFWRGDDDKSFDGFTGGGTSVWIGFRYPFGVRKDNPATAEDDRRLFGQLNLYARYEQREEQTFANNVNSDSATTVAFASYSVEGKDKDWRATIAASWNKREYGAAVLPSNEFSRISGTLEHRLPDFSDVWKNAWIEVGYGALSEDVPDEDSYGFFRLKFDMTKTGK